MKLSLTSLIFALLGLISSARGNIYIPNAKLAGESVYVRLSKEAARVTAVFEFESVETRNAKIVYFPIFSNDADDPVDVLLASRLELELNGKKTGTALPCPAPAKFSKPSNGPRICWFYANIDELVRDARIETNAPIVIKLSYIQTRILGRFYYLPIITGAIGNHFDSNRSWRYQLVAHSESRATRVVPNGTDFEQLADGVVVFLKDGVVVEIQ